MKYLIFYSFFLISCKNDNILEFTFIKLGVPEQRNYIDSFIIGSGIYIQQTLNEDSLFIKVNMQPDEIDSINIYYPTTYKIYLNEDLKDDISNFVEYSLKLTNGNIPGNAFIEPIFYDGGTYIIKYNHTKYGVKYFYFINNKLNPIVKNVMERFREMAYLNLPPAQSIRDIQLNTDSIAFHLCKLKGMEGIIPFPKIVSEPLKMGAN